MDKRKIAIITGASSGLGKEFVYLLDKEDDIDEIWLLARYKEKLEEVSRSLSKPSKVLAFDLTNIQAVQEFRTYLNDLNYQVSYLINCAGLGKISEFSDLTLDNRPIGFKYPKRS